MKIIHSVPVKLWLALVVAAAGFTGVTLWAAFSVGTFILVPVLIVFIATGGWLAVTAYQRQARWPRYGLLGGIPGLLIGGLGATAIAQAIGRQDDDGIEPSIVLSAGIGGAYVGALAGVAVGAIVGFLIDGSKRV